MTAKATSAKKNTNTLENKVEDLIAAPLAAMGYGLVRVLLTGKGADTTLQIMAERQDDAAMTADDCAAITKGIIDLLDADPALAFDYMLEVSSPGIDRPLVKFADYVRFADHLVQIELTENLDNRRRFKATIVKADEAKGAIEFTADKKNFAVPYALIAKAKLVITDALLKKEGARL